MFWQQTVQASRLQYFSCGQSYTEFLVTWRVTLALYKSGICMKFLTNVLNKFYTPK